MFLLLLILLTNAPNSCMNDVFLHICIISNSLILFQTCNDRHIICRKIYYYTAKDTEVYRRYGRWFNPPVIINWGVFSVFWRCIDKRECHGMVWFITFFYKTSVKFSYFMYFQKNIISNFSVRGNMLYWNGGIKSLIKQNNQINQEHHAIIHTSYSAS